MPRNIDRHQQRLVGERIEIGAELAAPTPAAGDGAIDAVADAGHDEGEEGEAEGLRDDQPDGDRHQQQAGDGDEIGEVHHGITWRITWAG
jgi:hypothetical protein